MSSVASDEDFACIPGLGENKQKPRKFIFAIDPIYFNYWVQLLLWEVGIQSPKNEN